MMLLLRPVSYKLVEIFLDYIFMAHGMIGRRYYLDDTYMVIVYVLATRLFSMLHVCGSPTRFC